MGKNRRPAPTWKDWLTGSVPVPRWWIVTTGAFILSTFGWLPPSARGAADLVFWSVNVAVFVWWIQKRGGGGR